ncbi:MAG: hypothetical protein IPH84_17505 [Bacteroidales bacterium]|nr:hypothetical protein [Bacteroidales bacterium]
MKYLIIIILGFLALSIHGQETEQEFDVHKWVAPYELPVPKDWTIERFLIPISFAPQIPYKGVEDIRFSPGWGKVSSEEYWTYAFLWYVEGSPLFNAEILAENLKAYYTGLLSANSSSAVNMEDKSQQVFTSFKKVSAENEDSETFSGTIEMLDYMNQGTIILHCKVHLRSCSETNKTILFFQLSPKSFPHLNWQNLDQLWKGFQCKI